MTGSDPVYAITSLDWQHRRVLLAAKASGLYLSEDQGKTWRAAYRSLSANGPLPTTAVLVVAQSKGQPTIFTGLDGGILAGRGWRRSRGPKWERATTPTPDPAITVLAASPMYAEDGVLFAGTAQDGVLRSLDHGCNWAGWNFGLLDLNVLCLAVSPNFASDQTVFTGVGTGLFYSSNAARSWRELPLPTENDPVISLCLSAAFATDHTLWAGTENRGLFHSDDGGESWSQVDTLTGSGPINTICVSAATSRRRDLTVITDNALWYSADNGRHWRVLPIPWQTNVGIISAYLPDGLTQNSPIWLGLASGEILAYKR